MAKKEFGKYYLGLDLGTDSVGWAATDMEYNLLRFHGNSMWGSRLFPEAQTAADRRAHRIARRRLQRRGQRLGLLQEIFREEIEKIDPQFFARLQESMLHLEDKTVKGPGCLFNDNGFTDKEYHKKYPTVYHLRSELIHRKEPHDVRLVYLALHHIIKYRGHFLFDGTMDGIPDLDEIMTGFSAQVRDSLEIELVCKDVPGLKAVLTDREMRKQEKQKVLLGLFGCTSADKRQTAMLKTLLGSPVKVSDIFEMPEDNDTEIGKIEFGKDTYEATKPQLEALLGEDFYILEKLQAIHDWAILENNLHGNRFYSDAKKEIYDRHKTDLALLKKLVRKYIPESYDKIFKDPSEQNNYCCYAGIAKIKGKKVPVVTEKTTQEDFGKYIQGFFKNVTAEDPELDQMKKRIEAGTFMPKLRTKDNGVVPNQIHVMELKAILDNASEYLPFLTTKDEEGLLPADKILQILTFRIPYYVGPLNNRDPKGANSWVERKSQEKIYPWNFDEIVDLETSAQRFITRMTSECTYLYDQKVLPQQSPLYCRFTVLNELNKLKIKGEPITVQLKQDIFNDLFMTRGKVTMAALVKYLNAHGMDVEKSDVTGIDGDFHTSMKALLEVKAILTEEFYTEDRAEEMVRMVTLFKDDPQMLQRILKKEYGESVPAGILRQIANKKYSGWGRLSAMFLREIRESVPDSVTGERRSIIEAMWQTNENLMQLLGGEYGFAEAVQVHNRDSEEDSSISYQKVKDMYISPAVKRSVWQALSIVKEIKGITGHDPEKVFVEMPRGGGVKGQRTESRKDALLKLYRAIKDEAPEWVTELEARDEGSLRSERLYLYYTQMGRCMYTGETIRLEELFSKDGSGNNVYDVDHIFPQSRVKDDSLDNKVLVKRVKNAEKSNDYPIHKDIRQKMYPFWQRLLSKHLISTKKFERLTRKEPLTIDELTDFVARQLVETRQGTKAVAELLGQMLPETEIVYVKAGLVSDFRHDKDLLKCREVNDLHHGKDAYLNIVVGNVYNVKFTRDPRNFFREKKQEYSLNRMFDWDVRRGGVTAWVAGAEGSMATVRKMMAKNNVLVTKMAFDQHGQIANLQLVRKNQWQLPMKARMECLKDRSKYGGYNNVAGGCFALVEHTEKGKRVRSIVDVPMHLMKTLNVEDLPGFFEKERKLLAPVVIIPHIKFNALFELDGFKMNLTGRSNEKLIFAPAEQLKIGYENECYLKKILKYCERSDEYARRQKEKGAALAITDYDGITSEKSRELFDVLRRKLSNTTYYVRFSSIADGLNKQQDKFDELDEPKQCQLIKQMLNLFACKNITADLSGIGLAAQAGKLSISRTMNNYKSAFITYQSITGLFEQKIDLQK